MGTWIAHLRIADLLLGENRALDPDPFLVGCIAPDAGRPLAGGGYDPPKMVTHWLEPGRWPAAADNFQRGYLEPRLSGTAPATPAVTASAPVTPADRAEASFLAGYYVHLVADALWSEFWHAKRGPDVWKDQDFVRDLRADGVVLDRMYLVNHPESVFFARFLRLGRPGNGAASLPHTMPYYAPGQLEQHVRAVARAYGEPRPIAHKHVFRHFTDPEMRAYVFEAVDRAERALVAIAPLFPAAPGKPRRPLRRETEPIP